MMSAMSLSGATDRREEMLGAPSRATGAMQPYALLLGKFLQHAAKWYPDAEVVAGGGVMASAERVTYRQLLADSMQLSGALAASGLGLGDRIATLAWNSPAHLEAWNAALGIGISVHTLNPRISVAQLAAMVRQADDRLLVISPDQFETVEQLIPLCPGIARVLVLDEPGNIAARLPDCGSVPVSRLADFRAQAAPIAWGDFPESAEAGICFTSGTTGAPKGVAYTHRSNYLVTLNLLQANVLASVPRIRSSPRCRCSMPTPGGCPSLRRGRGPGWSCRGGSTMVRASPG